MPCTWSRARRCRPRRRCRHPTRRWTRSTARSWQPGQWVFAGGLLPPDTATVVRAAGGKVVTTDGPFAETKEQIGGFWVIKAADLDAALAIAARGSQPCGGPVEVRPFQDMPGDE